MGEVCSSESYLSVGAGWAWNIKNMQKLTGFDNRHARAGHEAKPHLGFELEAGLTELVSPLGLLARFLPIHHPSGAPPSAPKKAMT